LEAPLEKKLNYMDATSSLAIWWKALFLTPFWGIFVIPLIGWLSLIFVNDKSFDFNKSPLWCLSLLLTFSACFFYYVHDLRKRVIRVNNEYIEYGLRRFRLDKLLAVGVSYRLEELMPNRIVFSFRDGKNLQLDVCRLKNEQFESMLRFVETRFPQVQIEPILLTLMRCKRVAGKAISDAADSAEISYQGRYLFKEMSEVFIRTWDEWARFGPVLVTIVAMPCWLLYISSLFLIPSAVIQTSVDPSKLDFTILMLKIYSDFMGLIGHAIQRGGELIPGLAGHPMTIFSLFVLTGWIIREQLKHLILPNVIYIDRSSIKLIFRLRSSSITLQEIACKDIIKIALLKPGEMSDPSRWSIRLECAENKFVDLKLAAFSADERKRFTQALQRLAPQIPVDPELMETLIPRQERSYTELWLQSLSTAPERKSLDPLQPGQLVYTNYQVLRCLGVGGQGTAYLCKDLALVQSHLSEVVVLKESIFPVYADSLVRMQALERFEKEANLLRRLQHAGIVSLRDYFIEDHRGYLVMEHVEGKTLKQLVEEEGALSEMKVRELAMQMCEILSYLHDNGVVHRDFTPDNLIMNKAGQLKLIDFNVAQSVESGSTGTIVGKQSYIPPEQFRGKACAQSDIYAMGATLHFLLTGEEPEPISQSSPLEKGALCSESLDKIVRECTALQLQKRMPGAEVLKQRLAARSSLSGSQTYSMESSPTDVDGITLNLKEEEVLELENK
jgi:Kae1-associated kinase Bud32